jgi:NTP pyrophosphatase (non-canonical NTP hydrolase)
MKTDQIPAIKGTELIVPLLGMVGEVGSLLTEYKKHLRDGEAHKLFKEGIAEELGDLLWYVANVATKFDLDLDSIAENNLEKCRNRWGWRNAAETNASSLNPSFDSEFLETERLPRNFKVEFTEVTQDNSVRMRAFIEGEQVGNELTDNSYSSDGYRFMTFSICLMLQFWVGHQLPAKYLVDVSVKAIPVLMRLKMEVAPRLLRKGYRHLYSAIPKIMRSWRGSPRLTTDCSRLLRA